MATKEKQQKPVKAEQSKDQEQNADAVISNMKRLPQEEQHEVMQKLEMYSGPIPAPHILDQYDKMDPGAAKQIIDNGVEESHHRRQMESKMLEMQNKTRHRRDWMGFIIGIISICVGGFLIYKDHYVVGTIFSGVSVLGLVGLFLGEESDQQEKSEEDNPDQKQTKESD